MCIRDWLNSDAFQSYEMFKLAVEELQGWVEIWGSLQENELPDLNNTKAWYIKNILTENNGKAVTVDRAKEMLAANINKHLSLTNPHLVIKNSSLLPANKSKTLLSVAYMQFFEDITGNKKFKKCNHPDCGDWFPVENTSGRERKFCETTNCATNYHSLKSRWKKYLNDGRKTVEEVAERLDISIKEAENLKD